MNKKKISIIVGVVIVALIGVFAATKFGSKDNEVEGETIKIIHTAGETEVPKNPEKVVVLDYASLDIMDSLDIEGLVGLPKKNLPTYLSEYKEDKYTDLGGLKEFSLEAINEIKPNLIIIEGRQAEYYDELSAIAPTIQLGTNSKDYLKSLETNVNTIGQIFDKTDVATSKLKELNERVEVVGEKIKTAGTNALVTMVSDGVMSVYGAGSRFSIVFDKFGFTATDSNIEVSNHGQSITYEYLLAKNPNYLFVVDKAAGTSGSEDYSTAKELIENDLVKTTETYKNGNIVYLNAQAWYVGGAGLQAADLMITDMEVITK
ncbi:ABC transporter substrate-binding protein [Clostridium sp.]|uniref:siderophore ABC transporter substrate-binding protein n=1 Tax=Clostridium sp. TaxID=1506 RepID=UPI003216FF10